MDVGESGKRGRTLQDILWPLLICRGKQLYAVKTFYILQDTLWPISAPLQRQVCCMCVIRMCCMFVYIRICVKHNVSLAQGAGGGGGGRGHRPWGEPKILQAPSQLTCYYCKPAHMFSLANMMAQSINHLFQCRQYWTYIKSSFILRLTDALRSRMSWYSAQAHIIFMFLFLVSGSWRYLCLIWK